MSAATPPVPPAGNPSPPDDRVAVVTGAAGGIGAAICVELLQHGWRVAAFDMSADVGPLRRAIPSDVAGRWSYRRVDVADHAALADALADVRSLGTPVVGVANAGTWRDARVHRMTDADWSEVIRVDLSAAFFLTRELWDPMVTAGFGRLVYISSIAKDGNFGQANYSAAKAGLVGLARTVAIEGGAAGITTNVICPGVIETPAQTDFRERQPKAFAEFVRRVPAGRAGQAADVAAVVAFFCTTAAGYVSGQTVYVDGGMGR